MKGLAVTLLVSALLLAVAASDPALARGGRGGSGAHAGGGHAAGARSGGNHVNGGHSGRGHVNGGHGRSHVGTIFGTSLFLPSWNFYPPAPAWYSYSLPPEYYYEDATGYGAPPSSTLYVEQSRAPAAAAQEPAYWYYCAESKTYYPYVEECPGGWQTVTPQAPSAPSAPSGPAAPSAPSAN